MDDMAIRRSGRKILRIYLRFDIYIVALDLQNMSFVI
jgi:hypothetical protein